MFFEIPARSTLTSDTDIHFRVIQLKFHGEESSFVQYFPYNYEVEVAVFWDLNDEKQSIVILTNVKIIYWLAYLICRISLHVPLHAFVNVVRPCGKWV